MTNGGESDVDCGGSSCAPCMVGDTCAVGGDCDSGVCTGGTCVAGQCGDGVVQPSSGESCDDGNQNNNDNCPDGPGGNCQYATCADGFTHNQGSGSETGVDCGGSSCLACPGGLLLSELSVASNGGEFIEVHNPSGTAVNLSYVYLADYSSYHDITTSSTAPAASDFRVRFPAGSSIAAGERLTIAVGSATDFLVSYGTLPDYDLDNADGNAPAMVGQASALAELADNGEMLVMFTWDGAADLVSDIDYQLWANDSAAMDKTGITVGAATYAAETPTYSQAYSAAPVSGESVNRCDLSEGVESAFGGNGYSGHDETSEDLNVTWEVSTTVTPGMPNDCASVVSGLSDDFAGSGPLLGWLLHYRNIAQSSSQNPLVDVMRANGRYRANLTANQNNQTLHYNQSEGRIDYKAVQFPFTVIARNIGIGTQANSQVAPTPSQSSFIFSGIQVHVPEFYDSVIHGGNLSAISSAHIVVGHRGNTTYTLEGKTTNFGSSTVTDAGQGVVPNGRADIRIIGKADFTLEVSWQVPNPNPSNQADNWILYNGTGNLPGTLPNYGASAYGGVAYVGLITYAFYSQNVPFVGTCDAVEMVEQ